LVDRVEGAKLVTIKRLSAKPTVVAAEDPAAASAAAGSAAGSGGEEPSNVALRWIAATMEAARTHPYTAHVAERAGRLKDVLMARLAQTRQALADVVQSGLYQHLPPANGENVVLFVMCSALGSVLVLMASWGWYQQIYAAFRNTLACFFALALAVVAFKMSRRGD
jgi:hypothetical protein